MKRTTYNLPNHAHFLTFSCYRRQRLLTNDLLRRQLLVTWDESRRKGRFHIWSYVIMPEHVHLLIYPEDEQYQMSAILRYLKEPFARWLVLHWEQNAPDMLRRIDVKRGRRTVKRFWQEGGGYDRNLFDWETIRKAVRYIEHNPVRRGLSNDSLDWKWSSARARAGMADVPLILDEFEVMDSVAEVDR
jgi:putative transposase